MARPVVACPEHGYAEGEACPACGGGERLLGGDRRERLSRYVSGALRHFPDDAGIDLDRAGWTDAGELADAAGRQYGWATAAHVDAVIATDPKGRFEREGDRVRAAYGHSVGVDLDAGGDPVPDTLYHGTAPRNLDTIRAEGLKPMGRQSVHLSATVGDAREVGERHAGTAAVLRIDAAAMVEDGHGIAKRGATTYTTDRVPPRYIEVLER